MTRAMEEATAEADAEAVLQRKKDKIRQKYAALLGGKATDGGDEEGKEITFTPGPVDAAEEAVRRKAEKTTEDGKSPWDKYMDKRKAKIAEKRERTEKTFAG